MANSLWRDAQGDSKLSLSIDLWAWSGRSAIISVPVILATLLIIYGVLRGVAKWPDDRYQGWVLLGVVLLSLLPVALLMFGTLASRGGSLKLPGGVGLSFEGASNAAASTVRSTTLSENLDTPSSPALQSTKMRSVLRALRDASRSEVTVVNLRGGEVWWESRLFILIAGAARRSRPKAIAFIGERAGRSGVFLGWAPPSLLFAAHTAAVPKFRHAERIASAKALRWELGEPPPSDASQTVTLPWPATTVPADVSKSPVTLRQATMGLPVTNDEPESDPRYAYELFLQEILDSDHPSNDRELFQRHVSITRLRELYEAVLVEDQIDDQAKEDAWVKLLSSSPRPFFALTSNDIFKALVPRDTLVTALITAITARLEQAKK